MKLDKKVSEGDIKFVLACRIGQAEFGHKISRELIERVGKLLRLAQKDKPFNHTASPHTWRHTFAISHLNAGRDIKMVARWLGDIVATVEKHYAHAIKSTLIASERAYDESLLQQGYAATCELAY